MRISSRHSDKKMKKHLIRTLFILCGFALFSSCMKDDPANNGTVFYGHQQIPNINEFMPQELLEAIGNNRLHFGDEPPKIEGSYTADNTTVTRVVRIPESHWMRPEGAIDGYRYFKFFEQHMGIAKLKYLYYNYNNHSGNLEISEIERSSNDSTLALINEYYDQFAADTLAPVYFDDEHIDKDVFNTVYIMGKDPYFTIYYYEVIHTHLFHPLKANIISGKVDKEFIVETDTVTGITDTIVRPVIKDFVWGIENMIYFKGGPILDMLLNPVSGNQTLPKPGDIIVIENETDVHQGEYQE